VRDIQWKELRGGDRDDLLQLFDHGSIDDVPSVKNVIDASGWPDRIAMGIGNGSDPKILDNQNGLSSVVDWL
jgi:hypothetical protein